jgi:hypothetical protein
MTLRPPIALDPVLVADPRRQACHLVVTDPDAGGTLLVFSWNGAGWTLRDDAPVGIVGGTALGTYLPHRGSVCVGAFDAGTLTLAWLGAPETQCYLHPDLKAASRGHLLSGASRDEVLLLLQSEDGRSSRTFALDDGRLDLRAEGPHLLSMAFDPIGGFALGRDPMGGLHRFDGAQWTALDGPSSGETASRFGFDPLRGAIVRFRRETPTQMALEVFDGAQFISATPRVVLPVMISGAALAVDPASGSLLCHGGQDFSQDLDYTARTWASAGEMKLVSD